MCPATNRFLRSRARTSQPRRSRREDGSPMAHSLCWSRCRSLPFARYSARLFYSIDGERARISCVLSESGRFCEKGRDMLCLPYRTHLAQVRAHVYTRDICFSMRSLWLCRLSPSAQHPSARSPSRGEAIHPSTVPPCQSAPGPRPVLPLPQEPWSRPSSPASPADDPCSHRSSGWSWRLYAQRVCHAQ
jgi:hypothetical protein